MRGSQFTIGMVQIGDRFGGQHYFPYAAGCLLAFAQKNLPNPGRFRFLPIVFARGAIDDIAQRLELCDAVFMSTYLWNAEFNEALARRIKGRDPDCLIVFGGPQIPARKDALTRFLSERHHIDLAATGEGELTVIRILRGLDSREWDKIPGIGFQTADGPQVNPQPAERIRNLDEIPSPYVAGIFDPLLAEHPPDSWAGLLETNRGCPYTCAYCYWGGSDTRKIHEHSLDYVYADIDWFSTIGIEFVFCCDANFGALTRDLEISRKIADNKERLGYPHVFSVQNTKNSTGRIFSVQKTLHVAGLQKGVNLALQSLHPPTLRSIHRSNISNEVYQELQHIFTNEGISTFTDLIIGLPEETYTSFTEGVEQCIRHGQHNRIQFINLAILENTVMSDPAYQKQFGLIVQECDIVGHHSSLDTQTEILEKQQIVVATSAMPEDDWLKTRVFCWVCNLLYFNKVLQIPLLLLIGKGGMRFTELIEKFLHRESGIIGRMNNFFFDHAARIRLGGPEYVASMQYLNIWWPADELAFIDLITGGHAVDFFDEARDLLLETGSGALDQSVISDAISLNRLLIKLPTPVHPDRVTLDHNIYEVYRAALVGGDLPLLRERKTYSAQSSGCEWKTLDDWCRTVVWYGTKAGAYLHECRIDR